MRVANSMMMEKAGYMFIFFLLLTGCTNAPEYSQGPCPFPPAESNFPVFPEPGVYCKECYFNIEFRGEDYSFAGNQLKTSSRGISEAHNSFLTFYLASSSSVKELYNSIGVKTPLSEVDIFYRRELESFRSSVSTAFGIYNYCKDFFEPITNDITKSYHLLTEVELIESVPHQRNYFYFYGELFMTFNIDEELQEALANYKIDAVIYERL
jgi:hypothetical protein